MSMPLAPGAYHLFVEYKGKYGDLRWILKNGDARVFIHGEEKLELVPKSEFHLLKKIVKQEEIAVKTEPHEELIIQSLRAFLTQSLRAFRRARDRDER